MTYKEYFCKKLPQCVETQQELQRAYKTIADLKTSHKNEMDTKDKLHDSSIKALTDYHLNRYKELDKEFDSYMIFSSGVIAVFLLLFTLCCYVWPR